MSGQIERQIQKILDEDVKDILLQHEGGVEIRDFQNGILKISLTGHCAGCPSAQVTTEEVVAKAIKEKVPEVKEVVLVHETSPELLSFARKLLNHQVEL